MQSILIAEDNPLVISFLRTSLEKYGFNVETTNNGESAVLRTQAKHYDLVVLDNDMPVMDGLTACRKIAKKQNVFFYSGHDIADEALAAGATRFLTKQCPERAIRAIVEYLYLQHVQEIQQQ